MAQSLARRIAHHRPAFRRGSRIPGAVAVLFVFLLAGCAPRGSMDFRIANLETQVMELEEQNRRQAAEMDARLDRIERYAVAQGVEKDRIRAAIDAARSDMAIASMHAEANPVPAQAPEAVAEEIAVEIVEEEAVEAETLHPVSNPTPRSAEAVADVGPGPDTPYAEPQQPAVNAVVAPAAATQAAERSKPNNGGLPWAYTEAVRLTRSGNTEKGRQMLRAFIMEHPDSPLVPNAYYWLGETYYHDKRYAQAILTFKEVTSRFPKDPKAAASMLKIGYSYEMLADKDNARFYLNALIEDYPNSEPAKLARAALDERF